MSAVGHARLIVVIAVLALGGTRPATQAADPVLSVVQPSTQTVLRGRSPLEAEVAPASAIVRVVIFFVDGQQACRVTERPFACEWDAGENPGIRSVRVTAELADGRRLVQTVRTAARASLAAFHSSANRVLVPVLVTDRNGHFVRDLTAADFRVYEDRVAQSAELVKTGESAASVLLALDTSASMEPALDELKGAAAAFLRALRPDDAVTVVAFDSGVQVLLRSGATPSARVETLDRLKPSGGTALYDAIVRGVDIIRDLPAPRAIVVFSDGEDTRSSSSMASVRVTLQQNNVVLYLLAQNPGGATDALRKDLAPLAIETGGMAWFPTKMSHVVGHFIDVVTDLRNQYVLAYAPTRPVGDGAWRSISVALAEDRGYRVRSREGYLAAPATGTRP